MTDVLSLWPVLDLIERWQQHKTFNEWLAASNLMDTLDVPALRQLAEQHAAQLREGLKHPGTVGASEPMKAAADFLCAPRREPEGE